MRAIPDSMDSEIVSSIDSRLDGIESSNGVHVAWAIESGSRAWGFPSPDSDYDARFLYLRSTADYLSPWGRRDVIETPIDKIYDVGGWDLEKALRLLVKGNGTVTEWLRSPIIYRGTAEFRDELLELAESVTERALLGRHYLHIGARQWAEAGNGSLKKAFYALRPAAILLWMQRHPNRAVPPMDLATLLAECNPPSEVLARSEELVALKAVTREIGKGEVPAAISRFIDEQFAQAEELYEHAERSDPSDAIARCEAWFVGAVERFGSSPRSLDT